MSVCDQYQPLAQRMRPTCIADFVGQAHLLASGKPLFRAIQAQQVHSMILWGPPGVGKTTLAQLLADNVQAKVHQLSAVLVGVKEIRALVAQAEEVHRQGGKTVLFVDEVHRFNKAQQDAFLPHVESGTVILIGATTENPSFQLNNALLSRARVYVLKPLEENDLIALIDKALEKPVGLGQYALSIALEDKARMAKAADGDGRALFNMLEILADFAGDTKVTAKLVTEVLSTQLRRFDHGGDVFYDQISALHKSVRGSDPDAALYWFSRMIDGGCDPHYIARRVLRMAHEDVGLADPRASALALQAWQTYERLGSPEGELAIANAVIYLACCAKSNAGYTAYSKAKKSVSTFGSLEVPLHLRNAPTALMKDLGYSKGYRYVHDEEGGFASGVCYLPKEIETEQFYHPVDRGLEKKISDKLDGLRRQNDRFKNNKRSTIR